MVKKSAPKNDQAERVLLVVASIAVILAIASCNPIKWMNEKMGWSGDNHVEEVIEAVIEHHTGIEIDFSPEDANGSPDEEM